MEGSAILNILVTILGILMSLGHFPQAYRIYKRKKADDVSLLTYVTFFVGTIIWLIYGISINELPIIISFIIGVVGSGSVVILILKYRRAR